MARRIARPADPLLDYQNYGWAAPRQRRAGYNAPSYADPLAMTSVLDAPSYQAEDESDPWASDPTDPLALPPPPKLHIPRPQDRDRVQLTPEDQKGLLSKAKDWAMSGLGAVGNFLDVPGSMVRDVLAGENPFDQLLHPLSSENRTSGRDLARKWGLADKEDTTANFWGGLGTEILTDPLTWLTLGGSALSKGGRILKAAGLAENVTETASKLAGKEVGKRVARMTTTPQMVLDALEPTKQAAALAKIQKAARGTDLAEFMDKPVGGLFGIRPAPFMSPVVTPSGPVAQAIGGGLDKLAGTIRYSTPVRQLAAAMRAPFLGATSERIQRTAPGLFRAIPEAEAAARQELEPLTRAIGEMGLTDQAKGARYLADLAESKTPGQIQAAIDQVLLDPDYAKATDAGLRDIKQQFETITQAYHQRGVPLGTNAELFSNPNLAYAPRYMTREKGFARKVGARPPLMQDTATASELGRQDYLRDLARSQIGDVTSDPQFIDLINQGATRKQLKQYLDATLANYSHPVFGAIDPTYLTRKQLNRIDALNQAALAGTITPADLAAELAKIKPKSRTAAMASHFAQMPDEVLGGGIMANHPLVDLAQAATSAGRSAAKGDWIIDQLAHPEAIVGSFSRNSGPARVSGTQRLGDILQELGIEHGDTTEGAIKTLLERRGLPVSAKSIDLFKNGRVPDEIANDLLAVNKRFETPPSVGWLGGALDSLTNVTKVGLTARPAFHARNRASGFVQNILKGDTSLGAELAVNRMIKGKDSAWFVKHPDVMAEAAARGIQNPTAHEATEIARDLGMRHGMPERYAGEAVSRAGKAADEIGATFEDFMSARPGSSPFSWRKLGRQFFGREEGTTLNPKKAAIRGFLGEDQTTLGPLVANETLGNAVEGSNRLAPWFTLTKRGVDPGEARRMIDASQVAYGGRHYTPLESQILARVFPFYKFCVPADHEILTRDGWKVYWQLRLGEDVLAMDPADGTLHWTPTEAINRFDHDGELIEYAHVRKGKKISFVFTDNHSWPVVSERKEVKWEKRDGTIAKYMVGGKRKFVRGEWLANGQRLITSGDFCDDKRASELSPRLAAILGWVVTDGYFRWRHKKDGKLASSRNGRRRGVEMLVYQSPKKYLSKVIALLGTKPRKPHPDTGVVAVPVSLKDANAISKVFRGIDDLCSVVGRLSRKAAESMWQAMFDAEGSIIKTTGQIYFAQHTNPQVSNAFQILCLLTGRAANLKCDGVSVKKSRGYFIRKDRLRRVHYKGVVWCPSTKYGTWVMRHNGATVVTGNSARMGEDVGRTLAREPGGRLAQLIRTENRLQDGGDALLPDYMRQGISVPLPPGASGDPRYLTGFGLMHEDPLQFAGNGLTGGLTELASRTNPLLKGLLEKATGQSFFQRGPMGGRDLQDLDPTLGRIMSNVADTAGGNQQRSEAVRFPGSPLIEQVLANSPFSAWATSLRTLTDPRKSAGVKAVNLLSGARIADVPPAATRATLDETLQAMMRSTPGSRAFTRLYIPKAELAAMDPEDRLAALRLQALSDMLAKQERAAAKAKQR